MAGNINDLSGKVGLDVTEFKTGVAELNRNARLIESTFKAAAAGMDDWRGSSEGLQLRIKTLNDLTGVQKAKIAALTDEYNKIAAEYGENSKAAQDMQIRINRATEELNKSEKELRDCTGALENMAAAEGTAGSKATAMGSNVNAAADKTKSFKQDITEFAKSSIGQFASVAGAVALAKQALQALAALISESADWADDISTLSKQVGITTQEIQKLQYATKFVDVEWNDMQKGIARVVKALGEARTAGRGYIEIADGITISTIGANGEIKTSYQLFLDSIDALSGMADATAREVAAQQLFGKSYQEIMPLIKAGSGALEAYGKEAEDAGVIISDITIAALGKLDDKLEETAAITDAQGKKMAAAMVRTSDWVATAWQKIVNAINPATVATDKIISSMVVLGGLSREDAQAQFDLATAIDNVAYITGLSVDEVKAKADEFSQYLIGQGVPAADAYTAALGYMAQGMDAEGYALDQMAIAQAGWDEQVTAATANYITLAQQYSDAVVAKTKSIMQEMGGLFGAFPKMADVAMSTLISNLDSQNDGLEQWAKDIEILAKRGIDEGLLQQLRDAPLSAAGEIHALATATDPELQQYVALWEKNGTLAANAAVDALQPLAADVQTALDEVEQVVADENEAMETLGRQLGYGIGDGIDASTWYIKKSAEEAIDAALKAARKKAGIQSPSKLFKEELGEFMGEGAGIGMIEGFGSMLPRIQSGILDMADGLKSEIPPLVPNNQSTVYNNTTSTKEIIRDSGLIVQFTEPVYINNDYDIDALAERLGYYYQQKLAANGGS